MQCKNKILLKSFTQFLPQKQKIQSINHGLTLQMNISKCFTQQSRKKYHLIYTKGQYI